MFIPVRSQLVGLIVTFSFVIAEVGALFVSNTIHRMFETRILQSSRPVFIYRHSCRSIFITAALLFSFLALEILFSTSSTNAFRDVNTLDDCLSMLPIHANSSNSVDQNPRAELISFNCLDVHRNLFTQRLGNLSMQSSQVICGSQRLFSYNNSQRVKRPNATKYCKPSNLDTQLLFEDGEAISDDCVLYDFDGDKLFLSESLYLEYFNDEMKFLVTKVYLDVQPLLPTILDAFVQIYSSYQGEEELHIRRKVFSNIVQTKCQFVLRKIEGTEVPGVVLIVIASLWGFIAIICVVVIVVLRNQSFINLSDPFWWAGNGAKINSKSRKMVTIAISKEVGEVIVSNLPALSSTC